MSLKLSDKGFFVHHEKDKPPVSRFKLSLPSFCILFVNTHCNVDYSFRGQTLSVELLLRILIWCIIETG